MFERAVFATDLSSDWDDIIGCVGDVKALGCGQIVLTHVLVAKGSEGASGVAEAETRPRLAEQCRQLESQGFAVTVETVLGLPAVSLNEVSQRHEASLIVVGSHGKSAWREAFLGSFSSALLHDARFPVLLINGEFSLVVMGTQGKSLLSEILLGSVAYNISRLAPCPALLIPRKSMQ